jgi:hypothetical protein
LGNPVDLAANQNNIEEETTIMIKREKERNRYLPSAAGGGGGSKGGEHGGSIILGSIWLPDILSSMSSEDPPLPESKSSSFSRSVYKE